jgi:hypothetical protein
MINPAAARERGHRSPFTVVVGWLIVIVYATGISLTTWSEHRLHVRDDPVRVGRPLLPKVGSTASVTEDNYLAVT